MLLSVTGGDSFFELPAALLKDLKEQILQTALTNDAWIITGGRNAGVVKLVWGK